VHFGGVLLLARPDDEDDVPTEEQSLLNTESTSSLDPSDRFDEEQVQGIGLDALGCQIQLREPLLDATTDAGGSQSLRPILKRTVSQTHQEQSGQADDFSTAQNTLHNRNINTSPNSRENTQNLPKLSMLLRKREVFLTVLLSGLNSFCQLSMTELFPLWAVTAKSDGGLAASSADIGLAIAATGPLQILTQTLVSHVVHTPALMTPLAAIPQGGECLGRSGHIRDLAALCVRVRSAAPVPLNGAVISQPDFVVDMRVLTPCSTKLCQTFLAHVGLRIG
jgi:hypothetical protein